MVTINMSEPNRENSLEERILGDISFVIEVPDWQTENVTPLQGFSLSLCMNSFLIRMASWLPSHIFDLTPEGQATFLARRICGTDPVNWHPQSLRAIKSIPVPAFMPFTILMLGQERDPKEYAEWKETCPVPPTVVAERGGDLKYSELTTETLQERLLMACDLIPGSFDPDQVAQARDYVMSWVPISHRDLGYKVGGHATVTPNLMALTACGYDDLVEKRFDQIDEGVSPYVSQIEKTTQSVLEERGRIDTSRVEDVFRRFPDINLFAPAMYHETASLSPPDDLDPKAKKKFIAARAALIRQPGYGFSIRTDFQKEAIFGLGPDEGPGSEANFSPHPLFRIRQIELALATSGLEALAASDISATIRLPNDINRSAGTVKLFADHYRSDNRGPRKRLLVYRQVKNRLAAAVPKPFVDQLKSSTDGIRIISNAPLNWLEIDGLPLGIRKNVSHIPVTPGNLFIEQLSGRPLLHLLDTDFQRILVISALKRDDPIKCAFDIAFSEFEKEWRGAITVEFAEVSNEKGLVEALNNFGGPLVVFDGHGSHREDQPGVLHLQDEECDIWQLREQVVSPPPIVVLSACDTHAADRNHATAANGFLSLGTRAVLGSVFPLDARHAAAFTARLLYRVAEFIPAAVKAFGRSLNWTEIVSGMLRMQLLTDFLRQLQRKNIIDEAAYVEIHQAGNMAINGLSDDPFEDIVDALGKCGLDKNAMWKELELAVANSSVISYVNMGRPETILIDTEERLRKRQEQQPSRGRGGDGDDRSK